MYERNRNRAPYRRIGPGGHPEGDSENGAHPHRRFTRNYTDGNGEVIFKKYSPLAELGEPAAVYADVLARRLRCAVAVCDREHIVAAAGAGKGELLGAPLPPEIEPLLTRRKLYTAPASAAEREPLGSRYLLCAAPILVHGDIEGGVLLHGTLREAAPNAETVRAAATAAEFLARWMEE